MNLVDKVTKNQIRKDLPEFRVGDTVRVDVRITEKSGSKERERIQSYEGIVKAIKGSGVSKNFVVRKISSGVGVERTFPVHSPKLAGITVIRKGKVRRAKLNFLKDKVGAYRIKERRDK